MAQRIVFLLCSIILLSEAVFGEAPQVASFIPNGLAPDTSSVYVSFTVPMIDGAVAANSGTPFDINCPEEGTPRWVSATEWSYDFGRPLPAGVTCKFVLRPGLVSASGEAVVAPLPFSFSTGGPRIIDAAPYSGSTIEEDHNFILTLSGKADEQSVLSAASFVVEGIESAVPIELVSGTAREEVLKTSVDEELFETTVVIAPKLKFPSGSKVSLVWGPGIKTASGVATESEQILDYRVRVPFAASFECTRANENEGCVPFKPIRLWFTGGVPLTKAKALTLTGPNGATWNAVVDPSDEEYNVVRRVSFDGPFPPSSQFSLILPAAFQDEDGRSLPEGTTTTKTISTAPFPPLAKFTGDFTIIERTDDAMLPVTIRNIERELTATASTLTIASTQATTTEVSSIVKLFELIRSGSNRVSITSNQLVAGMKPTTSSAHLTTKVSDGETEVVGIPLTKPGLHVVEISSEILGSRLLAPPGPMYTRTLALVTNLALHVKHGRESSLAWVTELNSAKPVVGATIEAYRGNGQRFAQAITDESGIARFSEPIANQNSPYDIVLTASKGDDWTFSLSTWNEGIESWRFSLPTLSTWESSPYQAVHAVLARNLVRPLERAPLKLFFRERTADGFALRSSTELPATLVFRHLGSGDEYTLPITWKDRSVAELEWTPPRDVKRGSYEIEVNRKYKSGDTDTTESFSAGILRVEDVRLPALRGQIAAVLAPAISPEKVSLTASVQYLAGGGADKLPATIAYKYRPAQPRVPPEFQEFSFSNGRVATGRVQPEEDDEKYTSQDVTLDAMGTATLVAKLPPSHDRFLRIDSTISFLDPAGERMTSSASHEIAPSEWLIGARVREWLPNANSIPVEIAVMTRSGDPVSNAKVDVQLLKKTTYSHRKKLVGGFYSYSSYADISRLGAGCSGTTDMRGTFRCEAHSDVAGMLAIEATTVDPSGKSISTASWAWTHDGRTRHWSEPGDSDRIDLEIARGSQKAGTILPIKVASPFDEATALVTVEREGILDSFVTTLKSTNPVVHVPLRENYAPTVAVSVLLVRGRLADPPPSAMVDLAKPAMRMGLIEVPVESDAFSLNVSVETERPVYQPGDKVRGFVTASPTLKRQKAEPIEAAIAVIDESLLEIAKNDSWDLWRIMMSSRTLSVDTVSNLLHVAGRRHFGKKGTPMGGGGGSLRVRELFDPLVWWNPSLKLTADTKTPFEFILNDSLSSFKVVAIAHAGVDKFGTGSTTLQATQDIIVTASVPPVARIGDRIKTSYLVKNTTAHPLPLTFGFEVEGVLATTPPVSATLASGESKEIAWPVEVPSSNTPIVYTMTVSDENATSDTTPRDILKNTQTVRSPYPVRVVASSFTQVGAKTEVVIPLPDPKQFASAPTVDALLSSSLTSQGQSSQTYMRAYPYSCLEQQVSRAITLNDPSMRDQILTSLPAYEDSQSNLLKFFPDGYPNGSVELTSYFLTLTRIEGWKVPSKTIQSLSAGLVNALNRKDKFALHQSLRIRALEALAYNGMLAAANVEIPTPTDFMTTEDLVSLLATHVASASKLSDGAIVECQKLLRNRIRMDGATLSMAEPKSPTPQWMLFDSSDLTIAKLLALSARSQGKEIFPIEKIARGLLARQGNRGWDTTVANAWSNAALRAVAHRLEKGIVTGKTTGARGGSAVVETSWNGSTSNRLSLPFGFGPDPLLLSHLGTGQPWATVNVSGPLFRREPAAQGMTITRTRTPVRSAKTGIWSKGDLVKVVLTVENPIARPWVALSDEIPAGATLLNAGLKTSPPEAADAEGSDAVNAWPLYIDRSFERIVAYYESLPQGTSTFSYVISLGLEGEMHAPPARAEAMYSPDVFGETAHEKIVVGE